MPIKFKPGQQIISNNFGLGLVVSIDTLSGGQDLFYVIEAVKGNVKNFVSVDRSDSIRAISNPKELKSTLDVLSTFELEMDFKDKKERITYYKTHSQKEDFKGLCTLLKDMDSLADRGKVEESILNQITDNIISEIKLVFDFDHTKSKEILMSALRGEPYEL